MILTLVFFISYLFGQAPLPKSDHVEQLETVALFQAAIAPTQNNFYFIAFYQDGCARCQRFIPIMNSLADSIYTTPNLKFGRVNCPQNPNVCDEQGISGLPGIKFFYKGSPVEYTGEQSVSAITTWINDQMAKNGAKVGGTPSKGPLPTSEYITQLTATNEIKDSNSNTFWMVVYYREGCQHCAHVLPIVVTLADKQHSTPNVKFGRVDCPKNTAVCTADKIDGVPTIRLYYKGASSEYSGARNIDSLTKWFTDSIANDGAQIKSPPPPPPPPSPPAPKPPAEPTPPPPPSGPLPTSEYISQLTAVNEVKDSNSNTFWMVVYYREKCQHCARLMPNYVSLADKQHATPNVKFGRVDCPKNRALCTAENIDGVPTIRLYYKGAMSEYLGPRDLTSLTNWYTDAIANDGAHIKNPPPPPAATPTAEGGLPKGEHVEQLDTVALFEAATTASQSNFYYIAFYQDGCPRCQRFIPIMNSLSDSIYSLIPNLKFGRVNCPKNPEVCTGQGITGLPGLKLFYKAAHLDQEYKGSETVESIKAWIKDGMANDGAKVTGKKPSEL